MASDEIAKALKEIALMLEKCSDDIPYELSAQKNLYFRMVDAAKEAGALAEDAKKRQIDV